MRVIGCQIPAEQHIATHCSTLPGTATYYNKRQLSPGLSLHPVYEDNRLLDTCTATNCNTLQHIATHCNTLQHAAVVTSICTLYLQMICCQIAAQQRTATHCNTLQRTATHCNTWPVLLALCSLYMQKLGCQVASFIFVLHTRIRVV